MGVCVCGGGGGGICVYHRTLLILLAAVDFPFPVGVHSGLLVSSFCRVFMSTAILSLAVWVCDIMNKVATCGRSVNYSTFLLFVAVGKDKRVKPVWLHPGELEFNAKVPLVLGQLAASHSVSFKGALIVCTISAELWPSYNSNLLASVHVSVWY